MDCAERSNLKTFECPHIQSLSYCPPAKQLQSPLSEEVLQKMVEEKWFGQNKKEMCLARQRDAVAAGTPLSCLVNVSGPPSKRYLSVFEPTVAYYSRLGRVMVSFDCKKITWHCPCASPRQSCIHKYVAKWHLFETEQALFRRTKCYEGDKGAMHFTEDMAGAEQEDGVEYPPTGKTLEKMVKDLFRHKKLPEVLPPNAVHTTSFPSALIPPETFCRHCPEPTMLSEPSLITSKGKIVTITDVIEGRFLCIVCITVYVMLFFKEPMSIVIRG